MHELGVQAITGCELTSSDGDGEPFHLTLLAEHRAPATRNLCAL